MGPPDHQGELFETASPSLPRPAAPPAPPRSSVKTTRVLVTGDRGWDCSDLARRILARLRRRYGAGLVLMLAEARAGGVTESFEAKARAGGVRVETYPAGRNQPELAGVSFVIACHRWLPGSKATAALVRRAMAAGLRCFIVEGEDREPRRIWEAP